MKLIFWGFFLVFLDFNLSFGGISVDILPDVLGYLLIFFGAGEMAEESERFARMRPIAVVLAVLNLIAPFVWSTLLSLVWSVFLLLLYAWLLWLLVCAVQDMEQYYGCPFRAHTMRTTFLVLICASAASLVVVWLSFLSLLVFPLGIASLIAVVVMLVLLWQAAKTYERLCEGHAHSDGNDDYYPGSED